MGEQNPTLEDSLRDVLRKYRDSFSQKEYGVENEDADALMDVFGITAVRKREHRQYWGRELGMCWQLLVVEVLSHHCVEYSPAIKVEADEPCDCCVGKDAIDIKYRIGSGDSGTLKKFKAYGQLLRKRGYRPVLHILRTDNLPAAMSACVAGGWEVVKGPAAFAYIREASGFDLEAWLKSRGASGEYTVTRA